MARTKTVEQLTVEQLTVEQQIAQIQKEAAEKIKQLQTALPWNKRFKSAFEKYLVGNRPEIAKYMTGNEPEHSIQHEINDYLREVNLSIKYNSATFDSSLYNESVFDIDSYDLTEYAVYTIFEVLEGKEIVGYVQINCQYSSYNGNEYSNFYFVKPKEVTCTVFNAYNP
jgi:hypothetical protein